MDLFVNDALVLADTSCLLLPKQFWCEHPACNIPFKDTHAFHHHLALKLTH